MKRGLPALISILLFTACTKTDEPAPANPTGSAFTAKVDGATFYGQDISVVSGAGNMLTITGSRNPGGKLEKIVLQLKRYTGLATYQLSDTGNTASFTEAGATYKATAGVVTIATDNTVHLAGAFNFTASGGADTRNITDGHFDIQK